MAERFVGLFDILGFRELLETQPVDKLRDLLAKGLDAAIESALDAPLFARDAWAGSRRLSSMCKAIQFSDTVVLYSADTRTVDLLAIVRGASGLIAACADNGLLLRGAITQGTLEVDAPRQRALGPALVRGHLLEKEQDWFGGIVDPRVVEALDATDPGRVPMMNFYGFTFPYEVPMKSGAVRPHECIGWPTQSQRPHDELRASIGASASTWPARRKIEAGLQFHETLDRFYRSGEEVRFLRAYGRRLDAEAETAIALLKDAQGRAPAPQGLQSVS